MKKIFTLFIFASILMGLSAQEVKITGNKFTVSGNDIWFNGINSPWHLFVDFGRDEVKEEPANRFNYDWWTNEFAKYKENKINLSRVWIFCNGEVSPEIDDEGYISGVNEYFYKHLDHLFKVANENQVYILPCLLSFDITKTYHPKAELWQKWLSSEENVQSFIDNVLIDLIKRYENEPYLLGWEICNEPEWIFENKSEHGNMTFEDVQKMHAMIAAAIHKNSKKPITTGSAAPKWNSETKKESGNPTTGNMWSDEALSSCINDPEAYLDFYQYHWYPWQTEYLGSPFTHTTEYYQVDDKPVLVGESSGQDISDSKFNQTVTEMYENAFKNGFDGVCAWKTPQKDGHGTFETIIPATNAFHKNHPELVYPSWDPIPVTGVKIVPSEYTFEVNDEYKLMLEFEPAKATYKDVTWSLENDNISIDKDGNIKGLKEGTCKVTASSVDGGYKSYCNITITEDLPPKQYVLHVEKTGNGKITYDPEPNPATLTFTEGTVVTVTAENVVGYKFSHWTGNKESTSNVIQIKMDSNKSLKAVFEVYTGMCENPTEVTGDSFVIEGEGEFCYVVDRQIGYVNSWNIDYIEINGIDYTQKSSREMPAPVDGKFYIKYKSSVGWGHFEAKEISGIPQVPTDTGIKKNIISGVYPNPFKDEISINLNNANNVSSILIFDNLGRLVSSLVEGFTNQMTIGNNLSSGIYTIVVFTANSQESIRVQKK